MQESLKMVFNKQINLNLSPVTEPMEVVPPICIPSNEAANGRSSPQRGSSARLLDPEAVHGGSAEGLTLAKAQGRDRHNVSVITKTNVFF